MTSELATGGMELEMVVEADLAIGMEMGVDMGVGTGMGLGAGTDWDLVEVTTEMEKEKNIEY